MEGSVSVLGRIPKYESSLKHFQVLPYSTSKESEDGKVGKITKLSPFDVE